jgi:hypothetical protein
MQAFFDGGNLALEQMFVEKPQSFGSPPHAPSPGVRAVRAVVRPAIGA